MKKLLGIAIIGASVAWIYRRFGKTPPEDVWQQATDDPDLR